MYLMFMTFKPLAAIIFVVLVDPAFGQLRSDEPVPTTRIFGRIVDPDGAPLPNLVVNFRNWMPGREDNPVKTDQQGVFTFDAPRHVSYEVQLSLDLFPPYGDLKGFARIEVADGESVAMGDIVLHFSPKQDPLVRVVRPIQITGLPATTTLNPGGTIAAVYTICSESIHYCDHSVLYVIQGDGKEVQPPKVSAGVYSGPGYQVGYSFARISENNQAVGWLVDSEVSSTSYLQQFMLVVYRPGKPLRHFTGDGRGISYWKFVRSGRQVAFYQDKLYGDSRPHYSRPHYELRDVATERLVGKWDGELTSKAAPWTEGLR